MLRSEQELSATHESIVRLYALRDSLLIENTDHARILDTFGASIIWT